MEKVIPEIQTLTREHPASPPTMKLDGSPVTSLDLALSTLIENLSLTHFEGVTIYSEENYSDWKFPLMAIDPLDGTREYIKQRPEWAVSIGHFESSTFVGEGWVYNPMTKELYDNQQTLTQFVEKSVYYGEVSHSEWEKGFYEKVESPEFKIKPMGSIAYKLGRLSAGEIDFVVSLAPKNIWDVAGGTLLCHNSGIRFYSQGKEVTEVTQLYSPPLIWCHPKLAASLSALFQATDKRL